MIICYISSLKGVCSILNLFPLWPAYRGFLCRPAETHTVAFCITDIALISLEFPGENQRHYFFRHWGFLCPYLRKGVSSSHSQSHRSTRASLMQLAGSCSAPLQAYFENAQVAIETDVRIVILYFCLYILLPRLRSHAISLPANRGCTFSSLVWTGQSTLDQMWAYPENRLWPWSVDSITVNELIIGYLLCSGSPVISCRSES